MKRIFVANAWKTAAARRKPLPDCVAEPTHAPARQSFFQLCRAAIVGVVDHLLGQIHANKAGGGHAEAP